MANSYVEYETAGSGANGLGQATFTAPTQFLSINDIRVKGLNGSTWTELTISSRGTTTVTLSATPTSGSYSKIRVFRSSTTEALIDFQNGSRLAESDLDTAYRQSLFVAQEVAEDADPEGGSGIGNIVSSQLANVSITNSNLAGGITNDKLASGVGTSANNLVKLDANAKLPAVDGSQLTNAGKVLQVKFESSSATFQTASTSYVSSGQFIQITPTSTSSKILLHYSSTCYNNTAGGFVISTIYKNITSSTDGQTAIAGGTDLSGRGASGYGLAYQYSQTGTNIIPLTSQFLDSPNSTSQQTYVLAFKSIAAGTSFWNSNNSLGTLTAMEIAP